MSEKETTGLATIEAIKLHSLTDVSEEIDDAVEKTLKMTKALVEAHKPDLETKKGREDIASLAYGISRTKTGIVKVVKGLTDDTMDVVNKINKVRKDTEDRFDVLRDQARAPLNKWEADEKLRLADEEELFTDLDNAVGEMIGNTSVLMAELIRGLRDNTPDRAVLLGRMDTYLELKEKTLDDMMHEYELRLTYEKDQAELEELRQQKADREEQDRLAKEEADRKARADEEEQRQKEEKETIEAQAKEDADKAAAQAIADAEQRVRDAEAETKRVADEASAKEKQRLEDELVAKVKKDEEDRKRAADRDHRNMVINTAIDDVLEVTGHDRDIADRVVTAIVEGDVTNVTIEF